MTTGVSVGGADVGGAGSSVDADGEVAQAGHDDGSLAGADLEQVLTEGHIPDPVESVLDAPVGPERVGELSRRGLLPGQVGDQVDGLGRPTGKRSGDGVVG